MKCHYSLRSAYLWRGLAFTVCVGMLGAVAWAGAATRPERAPDRPGVTATRTSIDLGPEPLRVDGLDRADLTRLARRTLARAVRNESQPAEPAYTPSSLEGVSCRAAVTLRRRGRLLGTADSERLPVVAAVRQAARLALENANRKSPVAEGDLDDLGLEIELISEVERVGHGGEAAGRLSTHFLPAIHGIAIGVGDKEVLVRPSQLISMETFCDDDGELGHHCDRYQMTIESLQEKLGLLRSPPDRPPDSVSIGRFRTTHWFQPTPRAEPVLLAAGLRRVDPSEVTLDSMRAAANDLARYLLHRQVAEGTFSYEFLPGRDTYWLRDQNWVRQAGTTWVLALYAQRKGDSQAGEAAERAIAALGKMVRPLAGKPRAAYVHTPDDLHALGTAALYALALMDSPAADRHEDVLSSLMAGIEGMQNEDGSLRGHFPPCQMQSSEYYYPGEALLAIARYYERHPDTPRRALCDRALPYYTKYFRENHPGPFVPWQAQAYGELARTTRLAKYADFEFEMTDWLIGMQLGANGAPSASKGSGGVRLPISIGPLSIFDGGIDTLGNGEAAVSTAVYLEGLVDAIRTADVLGDTRRAARYREAAWRMARFVMQLRFREEECYYVQSPQEVVGGVRNTPIDPTLRIDNAQHALAALLGAVEILGPLGGK